MGLIVDNFAGGGGASTGIEAALGRAVDIAINHDEQAIRMHEVNHPGTRHIRNNIWQLDPRDVTGGQHVDLAWFSPDCKHFSKAKGGKPREKAIRDLAWVVVLWAQRVRPDVILLENVEEFRSWGPLDDEGKPIKAQAGETFDKWCRQLRRAGYRLQFRELRACDYGAPTIRKRFFMVARSDGKPIVWPAPTHGKPDSPAVVAGKLKPWRPAAEIIDWSTPCPSIFERKKPLAENTLRRIARGIMKFVVNNPRPFIVPATHSGAASTGQTTGGDAGPASESSTPDSASRRIAVAARAPHITKFRSGSVGHAADEPLATVTANSYVKRPGGSGPLGLVAANLVHIGNGERTGQAPRAMDVERPLGTVVASGGKHAAVCAFLQKFAENGCGVDAAEPLHTVMA
ncbi:DNA cytosine methyltransferase, partial [Bradyrhizobium sp.]|uniref:DNA cytosine methyltransferase n=1 Tax=Bradyrhizobium sp. TaxID=376 RepID=UPI0025C66DAD